MSHDEKVYFSHCFVPCLSRPRILPKDRTGTGMQTQGFSLWNLRGRKGKSVQGKPEYREGYNIQSSAELHNEMTDDVKIILAEYRLALKKNNNRKDAFRDKISEEVETNKE